VKGEPEAGVSLAPPKQTQTCDSVINQRKIEGAGWIQEREREQGRCQTGRGVHSAREGAVVCCGFRCEQKTV
jgi:hypothetical protein